MERYQGKKAVIIGGTSGMGFATAKMLLDGGARVLVTGRSAAGLESAQKEIGKRAIVVSSDARSLTDIDALGSRVKAEFDTFDLLSVSAGFATRAPHSSITEADYDEMFSLNGPDEAMGDVGGNCESHSLPCVRRDFHDRRRISGRWGLVATLSNKKSSLRNRIALVTGGSSGIGLATAKRFVEEGAYVFIAGRRKAELDKAVADIGSNVTGVKTHISKLDDLDGLYRAIAKRGKIHVIFAGAGLVETMMTAAATPEHFEKTFGTNACGTDFTVQKALPHLNDGASIILVASAGKNKGLPGRSTYSATKAALRSFARTWTSELKDRRIRTNVLSPGPGRHANVRRAVPVQGRRHRSQKADHGDDAARAPGASCGGRFRSSVPRLRPKQLRHGYRPAGR